MKNYLKFIVYMMGMALALMLSVVVITFPVYLFGPLAVVVSFPLGMGVAAAIGWPLLDWSTSYD